MNINILRYSLAHIAKIRVPEEKHMHIMIHVLLYRAVSVRCYGAIQCDVMAPNKRLSLCCNRARNMV